jgi:tape measure domain-containing protein
MATETLIIRIRADGTRVVERRIRRIGQTAVGASRQVGLLTSSLGRLSGVLAAIQVIKTANSFVNLQNRIRVLTTDTAEVTAVTKRLVEISNQTRTAVDANARIFNRLALATKNMNFSFEDALGFTKSLSQALIISGTEGAEARGGLIQFSQGLAAGALRGEELRAVLEQLPVVAEVIANQLNVTRGALRQMGEEGRITTDIIIAAFRNARDELERRFARTIPTIGQSFQILQNAFIAFVGDINKSTSIFSVLALILKDIALNLDFIGRVAIGAILVPAFLGLNRVMQTTIATTRLLGGGLLFAAGLVLAFSDKIEILEGKSTTLGDFLGGVFQETGQQIKNLLPSIAEVGKQLGLLSSDLNLEDVTFKEVAIQFAIMSDAILGTAKGLIAALIVLFEGLPKLLEAPIQEFGVELADKALAGLNKQVENAIQSFGGLDKIPPNLLESFERQREAILTIRTGEKKTIVDRFAELGLAAKLAFDKSLGETDFVTKVVERGFGRANKRSQERDLKDAAAAQADLTKNRQEDTEALSKADIALGKINLKLNQNAALARLGSDERKVQQELFRIEAQLRKKSVDLTDKQVIAQLRLAEAKIRSTNETKKEQDIVNRLVEAENKRIENLEIMIRLLQKGTITQKQFGKSADRNLLVFQNFNLFLTNELAKGLQQTLQSLTDLSGAVSGALVGALDTASTALANFALSGFRDIESLKEAFSNLFADLARDITRFIIRLIVLKTISAAFGGVGGAVESGTGGTGIAPSSGGGFGGGATTNVGPTDPGGGGFFSLGSDAPLLQAGGFLGRGRPAIVGEQGPELFVPTESGRVVPNSQAGGQPQVVVTPIIVDDPDEVANFLATDAGADAVVSIIQKRRKQLKGLGA